MTRQIEINEETLQDVINIETGLFFPLVGFMNENDYKKVVDSCTLSDGKVFTIPITLDIPEEIYNQRKNINELELTVQGEVVANVSPESFFVVCDEDIEKVYLTVDEKHPGVAKEKARSKYRVGGRTKVVKKDLLNDVLSPNDTKKLFEEKGWSTIIGFQTRNPIHRAHEYIQRMGLELCDGLFINPITGWKKKGDFTQEAVISAYNTMIKEFYPADRVYMAGLKTQMRYAGPREAIFHAIIRRNLGCTHFSIGRDHAGVGNYYGAYDAHKLAREISEQYDLGIKLLLNREPYYCKKCKMVVTDKICSHYYTDRIEISGTIVRRYISQGYMPDEIMLRQEILDAIINCKKIFIE